MKVSADGQWRYTSRDEGWQPIEQPFRLTRRPADSITLAEMAERFGVGATTPERWHERRRTNGFPDPIATYADWSAGRLKPKGRLLFSESEVAQWRATYKPSVGATSNSEVRHND